MRSLRHWPSGHCGHDLASGVSNGHADLAGVDLGEISFSGAPGAPGAWIFCAVHWKVEMMIFLKHPENWIYTLSRSQNSYWKPSSRNRQVSHSQLWFSRVTVCQWEYVTDRLESSGSIGSHPEIRPSLCTIPCTSHDSCEVPVSFFVIYPANFGAFSLGSWSNQ